MISGAGSADASALSQLQLQQAQRNVQQAQARADALSSEAATARKDALKAERRARDLEMAAGSAKNKADTAATAYTRAERFDRVGGEIMTQLTQIANDRISSASADTYFSNDGQLTKTTTQSLGVNVDVTA